MAKTMVIGLCSGSRDRMTAAGIIMGGAAAMDMNIELYVLAMAARSFKKEYSDGIKYLSEATHLEEEFDKALEAMKTPTCFEFFEQAKEFTNVKIHVCGTAGKIWGAEKLEDFNGLVDDIIGIGEYITAVEESHLNIFV
ncbi:hypothetical protein KAH27_05715 [bacterium]|nr:hypothetical protein [bacterium]